MAEVREWKTRGELQAVVGNYPIQDVKPYCYDDRIGWDTYLVMVRWSPTQVGPIGFTNGPVPD